MILEQNYRKVAQYTQKSFKLYSKRFLGHLILQLLQKKTNLNKSYSTLPEQIINLKKSLRNTQNDQQNIHHDQEQQKNNVLNRTKNKIDILDKYNIKDDISELYYNDFIFLQIYHDQSNSSDKAQRLRVYLQLEEIKYKNISHFYHQINQQRSVFQIINPFHPQSKTPLNANSVFCLKDVCFGKFVCSSEQACLLQNLGSKIVLNKQMTTQCFLQFKELQQQSKKIISHQPVGIKLGNYFLRAQGFQINCNIDGSVFYLNKLSWSPEEMHPQFVKIKSLSTQRFLSSSEVQITKIVNKKTFSNVMIQNESGFTTKENQLVFANLDFDKYIENEVQILAPEQDTLKNIWIIAPTQKDGLPSRQSVKLIHAPSGRCLIIKNDRTLKLCSHLSEASSFKIKKTLYQEGFNSNLSHFHNKSSQIHKEQLATNSKYKCQLNYEDFNIRVSPNPQSLDKYSLSLSESSTLREDSSTQNQKLIFQICSINFKETKLILQLIEINSVLKKVYNFIQKVGFVLEDRNQSLKFCVEQIKKSNHQILYHKKIMSILVSKISDMINPTKQLQVSKKKIKNYIKELKILQTLILILKMINLKGGRKKRNIQASVEGQNQKGKLSEEQMREKLSQTPFETCWKYFYPLQQNILHIIQFLVQDNHKCSTVVIQESNFFNKLIGNNPIRIGLILKQALRNLGYLVTNNNNELPELFQWVSLIEGVSEKNIELQWTYMGIISEALVNPLDRGITSYQNKCRQILFNQRSKKKCIPRFGVQNFKPTITFEAININEFLYSNSSLFQLQTCSSSQPSFLIEDFFTSQSDKPFPPADGKYSKNLKYQKYVDYLIGIIRLIRNLCKDRNKKLIKIADDYGFNRSHIIACLNSQKLNWSYKMESLLLYSAIFVNQDPFLQFSRREVKCHIWYKIKQYSLESKTAMIFKQYTDLPSAIEKLKDFDLDILPVIENYLKDTKKNIPKLKQLLDKVNLIEWRVQIHREMESFRLFTKFLFEVLDFGYLSIYHIKRFVYFTIFHYQSICNLLECISLSNFDFYHDSTPFFRMQESILNQILKILSLHQKIWIDMICLSHLKIFQKAYSQLKSPPTAIQLRQHCWKLLNHRLPINSSVEQNITFHKNKAQFGRKNTKIRSILKEEKINTNDEEKLNHEVDEQIGKFLYRMAIVHSELSHKECYNLLISMISQREKRNHNIYKAVSQVLILNDKKQENIYRDYSGRVPGKILNVNKIYELIFKIKTSFKQSSDDAQNHKKTKEKLLQLNNLINKIRRELLATKREEMGLFKKMQQIISILQIDSILSQLLNFSQNSAYFECISNLYRFYLEFIQENVPNQRKVSTYFELLLKNLRIQKSSELISQVYQVLEEREKHKYALVLFQKLHLSLAQGDEMTKQKALECLYRIIRKIGSKQLLWKIKSQLGYEIFKGKDYNSLLTMNPSLSGQYINVLCQLGQNCDFGYERMRHLYPKITLRKLLYQQHKYAERSSILKLLYHFYMKKSKQIQIQDIQDLLDNFVLAQMRHIPSVYQYLGLQHLQINQEFSYRKQDHVNTQLDMNFLKQKFQDIFSLERNPIEPHQHEQFWNFIYNIEDETQMSLINFTLSLLKIGLQTGSFKNSIYKKLSKSSIYHNFIKYISQLCEFMNEAFKKNPNQYQRRIQNKLQEILILNEENKDNRQKISYSTISEEDKKFLASFFEELSRIIVNEDISYRQILKCANVSNIELGKRRAGQNLEKMILQEEFVVFIDKLAKHLNNTKQFTQIISGKKLHHFFNIYKSNKIQKLNIYKFLEKLIQYLESLKTLSINKLNELNDKQKLQNESQNQCFNFQETNIKNNLPEIHFLSYYQRSEVVLKLLLKNKWRINQQKYFELVLKDMSDESLKEFIVPDNIINERKKKYLVQFYLSRMCGDKIKIKGKERNSLQDLNCPNRMLVTDLEQEKGQIQFSRLMLMILRETNKGKQNEILIDEKGVRQYIRKKLEVGVYDQQNTLNDIIMELILNFNKRGNLWPDQYLDGNQLQRREEGESQLQSQFRYLDNQVSLGLLRNRKSRRQFACEIYDELINTLQRDMSVMLGLDLRLNQQPYNSSTHQQHLPTPLSNSFKSLLQILSYGLTNGLLRDKHIPTLESCFISILYLWAHKKILFSNHNWLIILHSIIELIDKHLNDLKNFAHFLANCSVYIQRYSQLINQCCLATIKSTNINSLIKISLFNLLSQFHIKFYLQKQQNQLAKILNDLDFQLLASTASTCYQQSIQPKLYFFQNQLYCDLQSQQHRQICTYEFCNQQKLTKNDNSIMETFVTLLIVIQMSINLENKKLFPYPLSKENLNTLAQINECLKRQKVSNNEDMNWIEFYKKYIGLIYILSEEGTLITLHYKIPYIEKYCTSSFKEEVIYLLKRDKETCIEKKLYFFSKIIQFELDSRKESEKIPLLFLILTNKDIIQMFILLVNFIHVMLLLFPSLNLNEVAFYPFTVVFIILKIIFTIRKYRKGVNMMSMIDEEREKRLSIAQKMLILMKENVLTSGCLVILYIWSFFLKQLFGFVIILEILTIGAGYNFFILLLKSFVMNVGNILFCFGVMFIYFGVIDWNKGLGSTFREEIIKVFQQFYIFWICNLKAVAKYDYEYSKKYPFAFFLYFILIGIVVYRNLQFFIVQMKNQNDILTRTKNRCLICNARQIQIETQGQTFEEHLKFKHNIWHYLYFFIYLRKKSQSKLNLNTTELFIQNKIDNQNYGFINISTSHRVVSKNF